MELENGENTNPDNEVENVGDSYQNVNPNEEIKRIEGELEEIRMMEYIDEDTAQKRRFLEGKLENLKETIRKGY